ncbi:DUF4328 domain-containing protein [Kitasatospora sp. NPDC096147]|uniref:DUF4328 domain-containing protein n=1 Tax=Kitasatospora sp. NPDC096147 TaxID=3364093 RepID=UPI00381C24C5
MNSEQSSPPPSSPWQAPPQWQEAPAPPVALRSLRGPAVAAMVMLGLVVLVDLLDAFVSLVVRADYQRLVDDPGLPGDLTVADEVVGAMVSMVSMVAFVVCGLVFLFWFHRARGNALALAPWQRQSRSPGWTVWGWIVPVVSFWFPYQMTRDAWRATAPQEGPAPATGLLRWWWALWLVGQGAGMVDAQVYGAAREPAEYVLSFSLTAATDLLDAVAAVLAILVVRRLTALQTAAIARYAAGPQVSWQWAASGRQP